MFGRRPLSSYALVRGFMECGVRLRRLTPCTEVTSSSKIDQVNPIPQDARSKLADRQNQ